MASEQCQNGGVRVRNIIDGGVFPCIVMAAKVVPSEAI